MRVIRYLLCIWLSINKKKCQGIWKSKPRLKQKPEKKLKVESRIKPK